MRRLRIVVWAALALLDGACGGRSVGGTGVAADGEGAGSGGAPGGAGGSLAVGGGSTSAGAVAGAAAGSSLGGAATCRSGELVVAGRVDDHELRLSRLVYDYDFQNKLSDDAVGHLNALTPTGRLRIEFDQFLPNLASTSARGIFEDGDLRIGNCETGAFVSTLSMEANAAGVTFTLRELVHDPYCAGDYLAGGDLRGCFSFGH